MQASSQKTIDISSARANLSTLVDDSYKTGKSFVITKRNIPVAKIVGLRDRGESERKSREIDLTLYGIMQDSRSTIEIADDLRQKAWGR